MTRAARPRDAPPVLQDLGPRARAARARRGRRSSAGVEEVLDAAAAARAAIEINGDPHRLDLAPRWIRAARARAASASSSRPTRTPSTRWRNLRYGVAMARRGWVRRGEVLNTLDAEAFVQAVAPERTRVSRVFLLSPAHCGGRARAAALRRTRPLRPRPAPARGAGRAARRGVLVPERPLLPRQARLRARVRARRRPACPACSSSRRATGCASPDEPVTSRACGASPRSTSGPARRATRRRSCATRGGSPASLAPDRRGRAARERRDRQVRGSAARRVRSAAALPRGLRRPRRHEPRRAVAALGAPQAPSSTTSRSAARCGAAPRPPRLAPRA